MKTTALKRAVLFLFLLAIFLAWPRVSLAQLPQSTVAIVQSSTALATDIQYDEIKTLVAEVINQAGGFNGLIQNGDVVVLKPNLVTRSKSGQLFARQANGMTTDWRVTKAVVELVRAVNPNGKIYVMEGCAEESTLDVMAYFYYTPEYIPGVDEFVAIETDSGARGDTSSPGLVKVLLPNGLLHTEYYLNRKYKEADVVISLPTLKNHMHAVVSGAIKNVGIGTTPANIYSSAYTRFSMVDHLSLDLHKWIHDYYLARPVDFVVMDGLQGVQNGPNSIDPRDWMNMRLILAGRDAVAVDTIESLLMGWDPQSVGYLNYLNADLAGNLDTAAITVVGPKVDTVRKDFAGSVPVAGGARIMDKTAPSLSINSSSLQNNVLNLSLTVAAETVKAEIYIDGKLHEPVIKSNYANISMDVSDLPAGNHAFVVHAYDRFLNRAELSFIPGGGVMTPTVPPSTSYEAESSANTLAGGAVAASCGACSGGNKVGYVGNNSGTLQFNGVNATSAGSYALTIYYLSGETRSAQMSVNGGAATTLNFPSMGSWETVGTVQVNVSLNAGGNTIKLSNANGWAPDFDRITVNTGGGPTNTPTTPSVTLSPTPSCEVTMTGLVYDAAGGTGQPIAGAQVSVTTSQPRTFSANSGTDGRYSLLIPVTYCAYVTGIEVTAGNYQALTQAITYQDLMSQPGRDFALAPAAATPTYSRTPVSITPSNTPTRTPTRTNTPVGPTNTPTRTNTPITPTNTPTSGNVTSYEAEASGNTLAGGAVRAACGTCSGGNKVGYVGNNSGTLQFNGVNATSAGSYALTIYYLSGEARSAQISVNGGAATTLNFASMGGWTTVGTLQTTVSLNAGDNTLKFSGSGWAPDFDRIAVNTGGGPTNTPVSPTATRTNTPVPPTVTRTSTPGTPPSPTTTRTSTPVGPTATRTNTPVVPTATRTNTPVVPTATRTNMPVPPTVTPTAGATLMIDSFSNSSKWSSKLNDLNKAISWVMDSIYYGDPTPGNIVMNSSPSGQYYQETITQSLAGKTTLTLRLRDWSDTDTEAHWNIVLNDGTDHTVSLNTYGNVTGAYTDINIPLSAFGANLANTQYLRIVHKDSTYVVLMIDAISAR